MMSSKKYCFCSNQTDRLTLLENCAGELFAGRPHCIVWVTKNALPRSGGFGFPENLEIKKTLIIFEGLPVAVDSLSKWRRWAVDKGAMDVQIEFISSEINEAGVRDLIRRRCGTWSEPAPTREVPAVTLGSYIKLDSKNKGKDNPDLLTMMFGSMGELLTRIDLIRLRFQKAFSLGASDKKEYLRAIDKLIGNKDQNNPGTAPEIASAHLMDHLPRLLLRGETGVGKTLIARYLQDKPGERPPRIVIPEYLNKEDMFEYALFGYVHGAYTGGREGGQHGILLENAGGVIFLDEIGEANEIIQAKLLAYLDDYRVRPRGWQGTPFYCPTLVVAATNQDLDELVKNRKFRKDLLARFTDDETIPPLHERVESLPFILDCLLQSEAINPGGRIQEIGERAFEALKKYPFPGNFRELEGVLRPSCQAAVRDGRNYICQSDLPFRTSHFSLQATTPHA